MPTGIMVQIKYKLHYTDYKPDLDFIKAKFREWGLNVSFDVDKSTIPDEGLEMFYETTWSWAGLKLTKTKSFKSSLLRFWATDSDSGFILCLNNSKTKQKEDLRGQHTLWKNKGLIEVYMRPERYIRDITKPYRETKTKTEWKRDEYVIIHEILHDLEKKKNKDDLHKEIEKGNFVEYAKTICSWYSKDPEGLLPIVKQKAEGVELVMSLLNMPVKITSGYRSFEEQNKLYAQGRTTSGDIVTKAKGGESLHNFGVAVDFAFIDENGNPSWSEKHNWKILGIIGKALGFEWGGDWITFSDRPHFEMKMGYTLKDFQEKKVDYSKYDIIK